MQKIKKLEKRELKHKAEIKNLKLLIKKRKL